MCLFYFYFFLTWLAEGRSLSRALSRDFLFANFFWLLTVAKDLRIVGKIVRYPYQRIHEVAKICSPEIQGCDLVFCLAAFSQDPELYHLLTAAKLLSTFTSPVSYALFVSRKSSSLPFFFFFFCQKVVIGALQEIPSLVKSPLWGLGPVNLRLLVAVCRKPHPCVWSCSGGLEQAHIAVSPVLPSVLEPLPLSHPTMSLWSQQDHSPANCTQTSQCLGFVNLPLWCFKAEKSYRMPEHGLSGKQCSTFNSSNCSLFIMIKKLPSAWAVRLVCQRKQMLDFCFCFYLVRIR